MSSNTESVAQQHARALDIISAIAHGDTKANDVAAQLRKEGFDALDVVIAVLARANAAPQDRIRAQRLIDIRHFSKPTSPDMVSRSVHRAPKVPFVLNGTSMIRKTYVASTDASSIS